MHRSLRLFGLLPALLVLAACSGTSLTTAAGDGSHLTPASTGAVRTTASENVVTCGSVIAAPGEYDLVADCTGPGIAIRASHVHLKLNGHTMTGNFERNAGCSDRATGVNAGICAFVGRTVDGAATLAELHIEGPGTVQNYGFGALFVSVARSHVEKLALFGSLDAMENIHATDNEYNENAFNGFRDGFVLTNSSGNHVSHNRSNGNQDAGFLINQIVGVPPTATFNNHLDGNTADGNGFGILLATGAVDNHVDGNIATGNAAVDLQDDNPNCDANKWDGNKFVTRSQPCIH